MRVPSADTDRTPSSAPASTGNSSREVPSNTVEEGTSALRAGSARPVLEIGVRPSVFRARDGFCTLQPSMVFLYCENTGITAKYNLHFECKDENRLQEEIHSSVGDFPAMEYSRDFFQTILTQQLAGALSAVIKDASPISHPDATELTRIASFAKSRLSETFHWARSDSFYQLSRPIPAQHSR